MTVCEVIVKCGAIFVSYTCLSESLAPLEGGRNRKGILVSFVAFHRGQISKHEHYPESNSKPKCNVDIIWQLGDQRDGARREGIAASAVMGDAQMPFKC